MHLEVKSATARASWGERCQGRCGKRLSQFSHFRCSAPSSQVVVITHASRKPAVADMLDEAGVTNARLLSFSEVADALEAALPVDTGPLPDLTAALLDVEWEVLARGVPASVPDGA